VPPRPQIKRDTPFVYRNEFACVSIRVLDDGNGERIEVHEPESGLTVVLEPIDFASFCHATTEDRERWLRVGAYSPPEPLAGPAVDS